MGKNVRIYVITLLVFFLVDIVWLAFISTNLYEEHIGFLLKEDVNWLAAGIFYLLYIAGLIFFVILPALEKNSWTYALFAGGFFGLITYATYDLTNLATLKDWPIFITFVDLLWGTFLNAATAIITFYIVSKINKKH
ncbi:DUF2177 family protein [Paenisporosarcina antarctica]|uniref:DUF2177 family protein n=1 Tax=Paenisporosarcina antarctica TaxID=417367 RepID=A0A4P7A098_9BACL|nr:DUF2177 family protein [Paenisporosarcina antarctica]QBP42410.1 DUF2177 family protein [Paenisporosarcina antarctica]